MCLYLSYRYFHRCSFPFSLGVYCFTIFRIFDSKLSVNCIVVVMELRVVVTVAVSKVAATMSGGGCGDSGRQAGIAFIHSCTCMNVYVSSLFDYSSRVPFQRFFIHFFYFFFFFLIHLLLNVYLVNRDIGQNTE